jgi:hypothetical protein
MYAIVLIGKGLPFENELCDLLDFTGADARSADTKTAAGAIDQGPYRLQIQIPTPFGHVVRVTDPVAELGTAATNFADFRHKTEFSRRTEFMIITRL